VRAAPVPHTREKGPSTYGECGINYVQTPDWYEEVGELTGGRAADCVVEIGGLGTLSNSIKALAVGGHISLIGSSLSRPGRSLPTIG
jgi:NADPH:quinone reductase-like Zn-dependent oxidoreductase